MAKRVARFEKVTYRQFEKDWIDAFNVPELNMSTRRNIKDIYDAITLPKRATKGSAGYDLEVLSGECIETLWHKGTSHRMD